MTRLVVDASVAAKWLVEEPNSDRAATLLQPENRLRAPGLLYAEVSNALRTMVARGRLTITDAQEAVELLCQYPLDTSCSMKELLPAATRLATELQHPAYDCFYLALALRDECRLVTADQRFVEAVSGRDHLAWPLLRLDQFDA